MSSDPPEEDDKTSSHHSPTAVRAVVFDLGGVVFDYLPKRRLAAFSELTGLDPGSLQKRLIDSGYSNACDAGRLNPARAHAEAERLLGFRLGFERFCRLWVSAFEPNKKVVETAQALKGDVAIAFLTNNSTIVKTTLNQMYPEVMEIFRPQVFSADIGRLKPHPAAFRAVADLLNIDPGKTVMVDDSAANVAGAAAVGFQTVLFHSAEALEGELQWLRSH